MKLNKSGQLLLVITGSLVAATLLSACTLLTSTLTADFVFVTSAKAAGPYSYGQIDVFEVNSESGRMRQIPTSPFPSGGRNPIAETVSTDNSNLFVVNRDDNTIVRFAIGSDGKVYPQQTVNTPGIFPMGVAVSGSNLFVADTYQPLPVCSPAAPCSGSIAAMPIQAAAGGPSSCSDKNSLCTGVPINSCNGLEYMPLSLSGAGAAHIIQPTAISAAAKGGNLFVTAVDTTANAGYLFGFAVSTQACPNNPKQSQTIAVLTPLAGSPWTAGTQPSSLALDSTGSYIFVTDFKNADVLGYAVNGNGVTSTGQFGTGNEPAGVVVSPSGKFVYVANSGDSNLTGYAASNGQLARIGSFATGSQPVAIGIEPKLGQYLYTADFLGDTVSGYQMNADTGALLNSQFSPSAASANPTAVASVPHNFTK